MLPPLSKAARSAALAGASARCRKKQKTRDNPLVACYDPASAELVHFFGADLVGLKKFNLRSESCATLQGFADCSDADLKMREILFLSGVFKNIQPISVGV